MSIYLRNFFRFVFLVLIQVLLLNKIPLRWWSPPYTPYIYPLFLLLLPIATPTWFVLLSGFALGLTIDSFMDTGGIHAMACVFLAFARSKALLILLPKRLSEYQYAAPSARLMGWSPFLTYAASLLLLHFSVFYLVEVWSLQSPWYLLFKILASLITSIVFVVLYALVFSKSISTQYFD